MKNTIKAVSIVCIILMLTPAVLTGCRKAHNIDFVESYQELKDGLSDKTYMVFPDLAPLHMTGLDTKFRFEDGYTDHSKYYVGYVIEGSGKCGDAPVLSMIVVQDWGHPIKVEDPIIYKGEKIACFESQSEAARWVEYHVYLAGCRYQVQMTYDRGRTLSDEEAAKVRQDIEETLYPYICEIIDESHAING